MEMKGHIISGVKVINIVEENATTIEKMANKMIADLHNKNINQKKDQQQCQQAPIYHEFR